MFLLQVHISLCCFYFKIFSMLCKHYILTQSDLESRYRIIYRRATWSKRFHKPYRYGVNLMQHFPGTISSFQGIQLAPIPPNPLGLRDFCRTFLSIIPIFWCVRRIMAGPNTVSFFTNHNHGSGGISIFYLPITTIKLSQYLTNTHQLNSVELSS